MKIFTVLLQCTLLQILQMSSSIFNTRRGKVPHTSTQIRAADFGEEASTKAGKVAKGAKGATKQQKEEQARCPLDFCGIYQPIQIFLTACPHCPDPEQLRDSPPDGSQRGAAGEAHYRGTARDELALMLRGASSVRDNVSVPS